MSDGHIVRRTDKDEPAQIIVFEKYAVDLDRFEKKMDDGDDLKPRERYWSELVHPEASSANYKSAPGKFRAELHERSSNPLYPFVFVMIALAAVGQAHSTRQGAIKQVSTAFVIAAGLRLGGLALNNIVIMKASAVPLLYVFPVGAVLISLMVLEQSRNRVARGAITRFMARTFAPVTEAFGRLARLPLSIVGSLFGQKSVRGARS
jgi:lipopolysaccharide export system permease protein